MVLKLNLNEIKNTLQKMHEKSTKTKDDENNYETT